MLHEPVMDPPRHWQIAADPRGCIMDPVMTRLDIAKLPRVFVGRSINFAPSSTCHWHIAASLWGRAMSTATPRV